MRVNLCDIYVNCFHFFTDEVLLPTHHDYLEVDEDPPFIEVNILKKKKKKIYLQNFFTFSTIFNFYFFFFF